MCRWLAYAGAPVYMESLVTQLSHSLIDQSQNAIEAKARINGDGFGLGWYDSRPEPGLFREVLPAWNDSNLRSLAAQIRSPLFFAHVRASTGTESIRPNCHPFAYGRWLFMHNGQLGGYDRLRRRIEALVPDAYYAYRVGTTDSELLFLLLLAQGLERDPIGAIGRMLAQVEAEMRAAAVTQPLRFTAAVSDGAHLYAIRYASDDRPPSLYLQQQDAGFVVVSEPLESGDADWQIVPPDQVLIVERDRLVGFKSLEHRETAA